MLRPANFRFVLGFLTTMVMGGCLSRDPQPGDIAPGPLGDVTSASEGGGGVDKSPLTNVTTSEVRFGPKAPGIPYRYNEKIATMYFFESEMGAEDAIRSGFFVSLVVRPGQWAISKSRYEDVLNLTTLNNMRIDDQGRVVVTAPSPIDFSTSQGFRKMTSSAFPFVPTGEDKAVQRTTIVYPDGSAQTTTKALSSPPTFDPNVSVNQVMETIKNAKAQAGSISASSQGTPGANMLGEPKK